MGDYLLRSESIILWRKWHFQLQLPHETVGGNAPPFFPPLPLPPTLPRLLMPRLVEVDRLESVDARVRDKRLLAEFAVTRLAGRSSPRAGGL